MSLTHNQEAEQQILNYLSAFDVNSYFDKTNEAHTNYFISVIKELDYIDLLDVIIHSLKPNKYQEEALKLINWYYTSWDEVEEHCLNVTEETQKLIQDIVTEFQI